MITLLKLPITIYKKLLYLETNDYIVAKGLNILPSSLLYLEFRVDGYEYYHVYKDSTKIGFICGFSHENIWLASRVYLYPRYRRYFKSSIDYLSNLLKSNGYKCITMTPDSHTAKLYKKHNIAKELKWESK